MAWSTQSSTRSTVDVDLGRHAPWKQALDWFRQKHPQMRLTELGAIVEAVNTSPKVDYCAGVVTRVVLEDSGNRLVLLQDPSGSIKATIHASAISSFPGITAKGCAVILYCTTIVEFDPASRSLVVCSSNVLHHVNPDGTPQRHSPTPIASKPPPPLPLQAPSQHLSAPPTSSGLSSRVVAGGTPLPLDHAPPRKKLRSDGEGVDGTPSSREVLPPPSTELSQSLTPMAPLQDGAEDEVLCDGLDF